MMRWLFRLFYGNAAGLGAGQEGGLVLVADGVGGLDLCGEVLRRESARAGSPHEVRIFSWGHGFGRWHADLTRSDNRDAKAAAVASQVNAFRAQKPHAPIYLVGKSGGSGVIVKALEALPQGAVEAAVLLAPALSPQYDLSQALQAVRREMVVFWSPFDVIVLGMGTRIFGTIDRVNTVSAGLVGFKPPGAKGAGPPLPYTKLRQVRWHPKMAPTMYWGGHVGPDSPWFLRKYVLPLLRAPGETAGDSSPVSSQARPAPIT
jgi:pimeloyl-ACP methyl ester carboxylesterase